MGLYFFVGVTMEQWLLGDLCSSLTEPKLLTTFSSNAPLAMFSLTSLCYGSHDTMSSRDDDVIVLDDDDMRGHKEVQRLVELVVMVTKYNTVTCLRRCATHYYPVHSRSHDLPL